MRHFQSPAKMYRANNYLNWYGADKHVSCSGHLINCVGQAVVGMAVNQPQSEQEPEEYVDVPDDEEEAEAFLEDLSAADLEMDLEEAPVIMCVKPLLLEVKKHVRFFRTSDVANQMLMGEQMKSGKPQHACLRLSSGEASLELHLQHAGTLPEIS